MIALSVQQYMCISIHDINSKDQDPTDIYCSSFDRQEHETRAFTGEGQIFDAGRAKPKDKVGAYYY